MDYGNYILPYIYMLYIITKIIINGYIMVIIKPRENILLLWLKTGASLMTRNVN